MMETIRIDLSLIPDSAFDVSSSVLNGSVRKYTETHKVGYMEWLKTEEGQRAVQRDIEYERSRR